MSTQVSVYLVDDHAVVRQGYRHLLEKAGIKVTAEAISGEEVCKHHHLTSSAVIVMDLSMPGMGGLEALRRIIAHNAKARVLVFSMHDDVIFPTKALQAGALGYVTKASAPNTLVEAVLSVAKNQHYISNDIAQQIAVQKITGNEMLLSLSPREFEVFRLLAQGLSIESIANTLFLDYKTIANTQTRLRHKLKVDNSAQLIMAAIRLNILKA
jgi:two-component system invasion response regulator UvrY